MAKALKQTVRIKPDDTFAYYNLGVAYLSAGDKVAAMEEYEVLKTLDAELADQLLSVISK